MWLVNCFDERPIMLMTADPVLGADSVLSLGGPLMRTILVAEDESPLRKLICRMLQNEGYTVLCAADGNSALRMAESHPGQIDLLVTDIRMPGMDGIELYTELRRQRPQLPVLFISGYAQGRELQAPFLAKPFTPTVLLERIRELLEKKN